MNVKAEVVHTTSPPVKKRGGIRQLVRTRSGETIEVEFLPFSTMGLSGIAKHNLIQSGLQTNVLKDMLETFHGVSEGMLLEAIGMSTKTLSRRADARLGPRHSDAAMALIEVTDTAQRVLGNRELAEEWLTKPALALDGMRPLDLITTTPGIESVKDLLTRMEYGVYA